jgi:hypothetical protein
LLPYNRATARTIKSVEEKKRADKKNKLLLRGALIWNNEVAKLTFPSRERVSQLEKVSPAAFFCVTNAKQVKYSTFARDSLEMSYHPKRVFPCTGRV